MDGYVRNSVEDGVEGLVNRCWEITTFTVVAGDTASCLYRGATFVIGL